MLFGSLGCIGIANGGSGLVYIFTYSTTTMLWSEQGILRGNDTVKRAAFGQSIAADPNFLVVGAPQDSNYNNLGLAYVFRPSTQPDAIGGWILFDTLIADIPVFPAGIQVVPSGNQPSGTFGFAVAIDNGVIVVGDPTNSKS